MVRTAGINLPICHQGLHWQTVAEYPVHFVWTIQCNNYGVFPTFNLRVSNYLFYPQCLQHILKQLLRHGLKNGNFCLFVFFSAKWFNSIGADSDTRQQSRSLCQYHDKIRLSHPSREAIYKHHSQKES